MLDQAIQTLIEFACVAYIYMAWVLGITGAAYVFTMFSYKGGNDDTTD